MASGTERKRRQTPVDAKVRVQVVTFIQYSLFCAMATFQAVKKAVTLAPTVRTLPSGIPFAPLLNTAARAPHDAHGHGAAGPRSDVAPRWVGGASLSSAGLVSKTSTTGQFPLESTFTGFSCSSD